MGDWELERLSLNVLHQLVLITAEERRDSHQHLVDENSDGPIVNHAVIAALLEDFRCEVLGRATVSLRKLVVYQRACEAKVDNLDVPIRANHDILKFEVSVHDSFIVQMSDSNDQLSCEELSLIFGKTTVRFENLVKFATIDEWHDKVQAQLSLKDVVYAAQEWMVGL